MKIKMWDGGGVVQMEINDLPHSTSPVYREGDAKEQVRVIEMVLPDDWFVPEGYELKPIPYEPQPGDVVQESDGKNGFLSHKYLVGRHMDFQHGDLWATQITDATDDDDNPPGTVLPLGRLQLPLRKVED